MVRAADRGTAHDKCRLPQTNAARPSAFGNQIDVPGTQGTYQSTDESTSEEILNFSSENQIASQRRRGDFTLSRRDRPQTGSVRHPSEERCR
jgi:hypothetical protein